MQKAPAFFKPANNFCQWAGHLSGQRAVLTGQEASLVGQKMQISMKKLNQFQRE